MLFRSEPALLHALTQIVECLETRTSNSAMYRLLHRTNLLQSLTFAMNERWIGSGRPKGSVAFETPYGATRIDATGNFLTVAPDDSPLVTLPQSALFGLLFGHTSPETVTPSQETQTLLQALFAPQNPIYWGADGF